MARLPKKISPFDVALGAVVRSKRTKKGLSQQAVAEMAGIAMSNYRRREDGRNEITVSELYRIAPAVGVSALKLVEEALEDYGGMEKLLAEHAAVSDGADNVTAADNVTYLGRVKAPLTAAADTDPRTPGKD